MALGSFPNTKRFFGSGWVWGGGVGCARFQIIEKCSAAMYWCFGVSVSWGAWGGWVRLIKHLLAAAPAFDKQKRPRSKSREVHQSNFRKLPINFEESGLDPKVNFSTWHNMFLLSKFQNSPYSFSVRNFDNPPKHPKSQHFYATVHLEMQLNTKKQCTLCIWLFCEIFIELRITWLERQLLLEGTASFALLLDMDNHWFNFMCYFS